MTDLKPCPFCSAAEKLEPKFWRGSTWSYIQCQTCGANGPIEKVSHGGGPDHAWNTRNLTDPPEIICPGDTFTGPDGEELVAVPLKQLTSIAGVMVWATGSEDFAEGGKAHKGFKKEYQPEMHRLLNLLASVKDDETA